MQSFHLPKNGEPLNEVTISSLEAFSKACRETIIRAVTNAGSGHPGGSLSSLEFLSLAYIIGSQTGEEVLVSNGHISAGVYSVLAELGYIDKGDLVKNFRKFQSQFEGHVNSEISGIPYTTGPLGCGVSVSAGMALAERLKKNYNKRVFAVMGDGEAQEGQVWEMLNFTGKYGLDNLVTFVDYNKVQLSGAMDDVMKTRIKKLFESGDWSIDEVDGHDYAEIWNSIHSKEEGKPKLILGNTIMGKGIPSMESEGMENKATWHGKAPTKEQIQKDLESLILKQDEKKYIQNIASLPKKNFHKNKKELWGSVDIEKPKLKIYEGGAQEACRVAYGNTLRDFVALNRDNIVVGTADLAGSVNTHKVEKEFPKNHIQFGIAEQNMSSVAGGLSVSGKIPVISTFANFGSNRAKDQNRLNDINETNVKFICTHAGLSVGEDGPTHQALDDVNTMIGLPNTRIIEPADPNLTAHLVQYALGVYGNIYMRMGRHKLDVITKEDGTPYYDENYTYEYGQTDIIRHSEKPREGDELTLVAIGSAVTEAFQAYNNLKENSGVELIIATTYKDFDDKIAHSVERTGKLIVVEDHFTSSGLADNLKSYLFDKGIALGESMRSLGPKEYQLSGTYKELYQNVGMDSQSIENEIKEMLLID